jgi:prepilin-type N-terminal cleavage/methylation domain-containing protein
VKPGFSLTELLVAMLIIALLAGIAFPRMRGLRDWIATDQAAREVTTALAVARHAAATHATRARLLIASDSLRIEGFGPTGWEPWWSAPGPAHLGVALTLSNATIVFGATGMGWGASNTTVTLRRGSQVETITVSRVGRIKRW